MVYVIKNIINVISTFFIIIGTTFLLLTSYTNSLMPKLGYLAYRINGFSGYSSSDYIVNFRTVNYMSGSMIIIGVIAIIANCYTSKK